MHISRKRQPATHFGGAVLTSCGPTRVVIREEKNGISFMGDFNDRQIFDFPTHFGEPLSVSVSNWLRAFQGLHLEKDLPVRDKLG